MALVLVVPKMLVVEMNLEVVAVEVWLEVVLELQVMPVGTMSLDQIMVANIYTSRLHNTFMFVK